MLALFLVCIGSLGYAAPPEAVLTGPDTGLAGDLIVLSWSDTVGDETKLIPPDSLKNKLLINNTDRNLGFSTRDSGNYDFILIAASKEGDARIQIAHVIKRVTITGSLPPPVDPGDPPPPDDPPPNPKPLAELTKFVKQTTANLNDPTTAKALAKTIRDNIDKMKSASDRQAAFAAMGIEIERTLLKRTGSSRNVDWLNKWRIPVNMEINRFESTIVNSADAAAVMLAVADGLSQ